MFPRVLCHAAGIAKSARGHNHNLHLLLFAVGPQARHFAPTTTAPWISTVRKFSAKNGDSSSNKGSLHHDAKEGVSNYVVSGTPKDSVSDPPMAATSTTGKASKAPSSGSNSTTPGSSSSVLADYYDKAFQLWTERSGTKEILALKESVNEAGVAFDKASADVTKSRKSLDEALREWERASGQHMQLLQRRESWTPQDAQKFADFVSLEITSKGELERARHDLGRSEEILTKSQLDYINKMRRRYHEEQIWQDQWRVLGTYGTWTLIVLNSCVFLGSQFFQRRREKERTETIERLIRESRSEDAPSESRAVAAVPREEEEETETPANAVVVVEVRTEKNDENRTKSNEQEAVDEENSTEKLDTRSSTTTEIEEEPAVKVKSTAMIDVSRTKMKQQEALSKSEEKPKLDESPIIDEKERTLVQPEGVKPRPVVVAVEKIGAAAASVGLAVKRWKSTVRSKTKEVVGSMNQRLHAVVPAGIANEMPESASDIHVPSALIGASVGGIAALAISMIISSLSNRRH